jgi:hypothetical protein
MGAKKTLWIAWIINFVFGFLFCICAIVNASAVDKIRDHAHGLGDSSTEDLITAIVTTQAYGVVMCIIYGTFSLLVLLRKVRVVCLCTSRGVIDGDDAASRRASSAASDRPRRFISSRAAASRRSLNDFFSLRRSVVSRRHLTHAPSPPPPSATNKTDDREQRRGGHVRRHHRQRRAHVLRPRASLRAVDGARVLD